MNTEYASKRMAELGLKPAKLAEACGVSEGHIRHVLNGLRPSRTLLILMAQTLQCSADDLVTPVQTVSPKTVSRSTA